MPIIDLRSDTVTKPTPEMRRAMAEAEVGDDVFGDDPTVKALEERAAELLGKEAGLFVASGAMGNLVAQMAWLQRGQEAIVSAHGHIVLHEAASHAVVVGSGLRTIEEQPDGTLDLQQVREAFRDPTDVHDPITGLVVFENASAHANNQPVPSSYVRELGALAHDRGVPLHIDGARFWNRIMRTRASSPRPLRRSPASSPRVRPHSPPRAAWIRAASGRTSCSSASSATGKRSSPRSSAEACCCSRSCRTTARSGP